MGMLLAVRVDFNCCSVLGDVRGEVGLSYEGEDDDD